MRHDGEAMHTPSFAVRPVKFEDVAAALGLIERAVQRGCRDHYSQSQRAAVFASYAQTLFVDSLGPVETIAAELKGQLVGVAQLDPAAERLRGLFVDGEFQRRGIGASLLSEVVERARRRGATRIHGAMSLNAVPFYRRAGFLPCDGPELLVAGGVSLPVLRMEMLLGDSQLTG
jgi:GNAT superfamily N-acetyltransferase